MRILVTGGAGYKGTLLVKALLDRGHSVTLLDNFMFGYGSVLHLVGEPKLSVAQMDLRGLDEKTAAQCDAVFHLAGISGMPGCAANPHSAETINVGATRRLVSFLHKDQLLINASTTSLYGATAGECDEAVAVEPPSLYARTKYEAEKIAQGRPNSISLRFATVFGVSPRMRNDLLVNDFTYKAVTDRALVVFAGRSKRTFIHIHDAVAGYLFALDHAEAMRGGVYNVGSEDLNLSKNDIAAAIRKHVPFENIVSSLPDFDVRDFFVSFKKIRALGYATTRTLDQGILELVKLYSFYRTYVPYNVI